MHPPRQPTPPVRRFRGAALFVGFTAAACTISEPSVEVRGQDSAVDLARAAVATRIGVEPSDLTLIDEAPLRLTHAQIEAASFKFVVGSSGELHGATILGDVEVDPRQLRELEVQARADHYGRLDPALYDFLAAEDESAPVPVAIWLAHSIDDSCAAWAPPPATDRDRPGPLVGPLAAGVEDPDNDDDDLDLDADGEPIPPGSNDDDDVETPADDGDDPGAEEDIGAPAQPAQLPAAASLSHAEAQALNFGLAQCRRGAVAATLAPFLTRLESELDGGAYGPITAESIADDGTSNGPPTGIPEGHRPAQIQTLAPLVQVALTPAEIAKVASWPEVDTIYRDTTVVDHLAHSRPSIGADHLHDWGVEGEGSKVGVVEVNGALGFDFADNNAVDMARITVDSTDACLMSNHPDAVVGVIHSQDKDNRGIAPKAQIRVGGGCSGHPGNNTVRLEDASDRAVAWGATALNLSFGDAVGPNSPPAFFPGFFDRFYDDIVFNTGTSVVVSAGNEGGAGGQITSPSLGYGVIGVGSYDDHDTAAWSDDTMAPSSSFVGPRSLHNDRTKPELAAPGEGIKTLEDDGTVTTGGTSLAAPHVTGAVALLQERDPWLILFPEGVKAVLMASAVHNIVGDARLSAGDGAGGLVVDGADNIFRGLTGDWGGDTFTCQEGGFRVVDTIQLRAGLRTRVAVVWAAEGAYNRYALEPSADLDLGIWSGSVRVASSGSWENNYEIVDFVPATTGNHQIRVHDYRCDGVSARRVAWAWTQEFPAGVEYGVELSGQGWGSWASNAATAGNTSGNRRIERLRARGINGPAGMNVEYQVRQFDAGWSPVRRNGEGAGVDGRKLQIVKMWLWNQPTGWSLEYRVYRPTFGWTDWAGDGEAAGATPLSSEKRGIQARIVPAHP